MATSLSFNSSDCFADFPCTAARRKWAFPIFSTRPRSLSNSDCFLPSSCREDREVDPTSRCCASSIPDCSLNNLTRLYSVDFLSSNCCFSIWTWENSTFAAFPPRVFLFPPSFVRIANDSTNCPLRWRASCVSTSNYQCLASVERIPSNIIVSSLKNGNGNLTRELLRAPPIRNQFEKTYVELMPRRFAFPSLDF